MSLNHVLLLSLQYDYKSCSAKTTLTSVVTPVRMLFKVLLAGTAIASVLACPDHENFYRPQSHLPLAKRQNPSTSSRNATDWSYETSYDWGRVNPGKSSFKIVHMSRELNSTSL